jgi:lipopolysaccharide transport system ATP-binding protein
MSQNAIDVRGLSKFYQIRKQQSGPAPTLREDIGNMFSRGYARLRNPIRTHEDSFEEFRALDDVSFSIQPGQRVGIIGRNGAGKSTLLKILSRITAPTRGEAMLRGRVASLLEVGTGFSGELTGRENIFLNGAILGMNQQEIRKRFDEIVDFAEIGQFLDTPVKRYSSGMYVRLAFSIAAHLEPEILIVDEVLAVGDMAFQKKCLGRMEKVGDEGRTILFVSHNTSTIARLCDQCIFLEKGKLISQGPTHSVIRDYLSSNISNDRSYTLPAKPDQTMALRSVSLNPGSEGVGTDIPYDEPITIRIEYDVNQDTDNSVVWIALQTMEGVIAFVTSDYDMDVTKLGKRVKGRYITDIKIPEKWLNVGEYVVIAGLVKNNPLEVYHREETITFRIEEIGTPGAILMPGQRRGILQPYIKWHDVA